MAERPAVNTSPLIFLAKAGLLDLLRLAGDRLVVSTTVATELSPRSDEDPVVSAIRNASWLEITPAIPTPPIIQAWDLGDGESSVLAWGYRHPGTEVIIDDLAARRCARALGIPVRGTLGLILTAKERGIIAAARPVIECLRTSGMYLSDQVINEALRLVGE